MKRTLAILVFIAVNPVLAQTARPVGEVRRTAERIDEAAELAKQSKWDQAVALYQRIADTAGDDLVPVDPRLYRPARAVIAERIRGRGRTAVNDDRLGDLAFERGEFTTARHHWNAVETPLARAKSILAGLFLGEPIADAITEFRLKYPNDVGHLAGNDGPLADILTTLARKPADTTIPVMPRIAANTFAVTADRRGGLTLPLPTAAPRVAWPAVPLTDDDEPAAVTPRQLVWHPLIWQGHAVVSDGRNVLAIDLATGERVGRFDAFPTLDANPDLPDRPHPLTVFGSRVIAHLSAGKADLIVALERDPDVEAFRWRKAWELPVAKAAGVGDGVLHFDGCPVVDSGKLYASWSRVSGNRSIVSIGCWWLDSMDAPIWTRAVAEVPVELETKRGRLLTVAGGHVVLGTEAGLIVALDAVTGRPAWTHRYPGRSQKSVTGDLLPVPRDLVPCIAADGRVFAAPSDTNEVIALDLFTGASIWSKPLSLEVVHLLGVAGQRLILTADGLATRGIGAFDVRTGRHDPEWDSLTSGERPWGRGLLFADGLLFPRRKDGPVPMRLDGRLVYAPAVFHAAPGGNLAVGDGYLLIASAGKLHGLKYDSAPIIAATPATTVRVAVAMNESPSPRLASLKPLWKCPLPDAAIPLKVNERGAIVATSTGVALHSLPKGDLVWSATLRFRPTWISGDLVAGRDGLARINLTTGTVVWARDLDSLDAFERTATLGFARQGGRQLIAIDLGTGRDAWIHAVGPDGIDPLYLADERHVVLKIDAGRVRFLDAATGGIKAVTAGPDVPWTGRPNVTREGAIAFADSPDRVVAIDPVAFQQKWAFDLPKALDPDGVPPSVLRLGDSLWVRFTSNTGTVLRQLDPRTGRVASGDPGLPPMRGRIDLSERDGSLVLAAEGRLRAYDRNTGRRRWEQPLPAADGWNLDSIAGGWIATMIRPSWNWGDGHLMAGLRFDDRDGKIVERWETKTAGPAIATGHRTIAVSGIITGF